MIEIHANFQKSGYFEGWDESTQDGYCPEIASASNSPTRTDQSDETPKYDADSLLPSACLGKTRPMSIRRNAEIQQSPLPSRRRTKRYGIVPYADPDPGNVAVTNLNDLLHNSMSNTEDILAAMYSPDWDAASLQKWYDQSQKSPADLALFKIMFSLRYTIEETSPLVTR